jgi:hypothetical protein
MGSQHSESIPTVDLQIEGFDLKHRRGIRHYTLGHWSYNERWRTAPAGTSDGVTGIAVALWPMMAVRQNWILSMLRWLVPRDFFTKLRSRWSTLLPCSSSKSRRLQRSAQWRCNFPVLHRWWRPPSDAPPSMKPEPTGSLFPSLASSRVQLLLAVPKFIRMRSPSCSWVLGFADQNLKEIRCYLWGFWCLIVEHKETNTFYLHLNL